MIRLGSLSLALYLGLTARAAGWADRRLQARQERGKEHPERIGERRGVAGVPRPKGPVVWIHAASVGEANAVLELVDRIGKARPGSTVLLTTGTVTSAEVVIPRLPKHAIHQFVPMDAGPFVKGFLDHWQPDLAIWTESELWPRLIYDTHKRGIPMLLINARMSQTSHDRWRWFPGFAHALLGRFRHVLAQDTDTATRLRALGLRPDRIEVIGTLKEGAPVPPCDQAARKEAAAWFGTRPRWLAASTHPGEEELVATAHRTALRSAHRLLLILAPRHPERGDAIAEALRADGWDVAQRSKAEVPGQDTQIYLVDTLGEMGLWFRLAPVSFVGGSLVGIGGHNPFEPAALGSAILHGASVSNFVTVYQRLGAAGAAKQVVSAEGLAREVDRLLAPDAAAAMAHAAWEVTSQGAAVTQRALDVVLADLDRSTANATNAKTAA